MTRGRNLASPAPFPAFARFARIACGKSLVEPDSFLAIRLLRSNASDSTMRGAVWLLCQRRRTGSSNFTMAGGSAPTTARVGSHPDNVRVGIESTF